MKKLFALILTLTLTFSLCACSGIESLENLELPPLPTETPAPTAAVPTETPAPEETPAPKNEPQVMVTVSRTEKKEYDPQFGATLILSFSYDTPAVYIDGNDAAAARINEYAALLDESYYTGENYGDGSGTGYSNMLTLAEDNYNYLYDNGIQDGMYEMVSSRTVTVERSDAQVLTLLYNDYSFTGGAHGFYGSRAYCFDAETGELLTLDTISSDAVKLEDFLTELMVTTAENDDSLLERLDQTLIPDGDLEQAFSTLLRDGSWYFSRDGLVIFSDLYEISSYAAGPIEFVVPYDRLIGEIDDKWLPKTAEAQGSFSVVAAEDMVDGTTVILDKLTENAQGRELYLVAQGRVNDVKLSSVDYVESFYETAQLWNCSYMKDSALQLVTMIPDGMPNLMISYSDADGRHRLLLTESGEDGSLILMDDNIQAVG